jgi:predicted DNA-binding transcriptional regulator AlpA
MRIYAVAYCGVKHNWGNIEPRKGVEDMRLLTLVDVARALGVSYTTANKIKGTLPGCVQLGTRRRWRESDIAQFAGGGEQPRTGAK